MVIARDYVSQIQIMPVSRNPGIFSVRQYSGYQKLFAHFEILDKASLELVQGYPTGLLNLSSNKPDEFPAPSATGS